MSADKAVKFLKALGATNTEEIGDGWVRCSCPLAPWTHKNGTDNHPSFSLNHESGMHYNCFTCGSGSAAQLLQEIEMHLVKYPGMKSKYHIKEARDILNDGADIDTLGEFLEFEEKKKVFTPWDEDWLESFSPAHKIKRSLLYMESRGITLQQSEKYRLKYDSNRDYLMFPYWNMYGKLAGVRGRLVEFPGEMAKNLKHYDYTLDGVSNAGLVWYNEQALTEGEAVVVVEGQIDALEVSKVYPYVVANMTAKPTQYKLDKLLYAPKIILMLDNDKAGRVAEEKYKKFLVGCNKDVDVIHLPNSDKKIDPSDMGAEWIKSRLESKGVLPKEGG